MREGIELSSWEPGKKKSSRTAFGVVVRKPQTKVGPGVVSLLHRTNFERDRH
jgi:hypothetical protein